MPKPTSRQFLTAAILLTAPTIVALDVFVFFGSLELWLAITVVLTAAIGSTAVVWFFYSDLATVTDYVLRLSQRRPGEAIPAPEPKAQMLRDLTATIARLDRLARRRAAALERRRADDAVILDALDDPLFLLDADRRVLRLNRAAREAFGAGARDRDLALSVRHPAVLTAVDELLAGGTPAPVEVALAGPVERVFVARLTRLGGGLGEEGGDDAPEELSQPIAAMLTLQDITTLRRTEQMRESFVANVSHELRTPLSALIGFIETIRGPARDDAAARDRFLGIMDDQARRMARLVTDLLTLGRLEVNTHEAPTGTADLADVLGAARLALDHRAQQRRMPLVLAAPAGLPLLRGDRDQLVQVFQNLLDNAVKYGAEGTEVTIEVAAPELGPRGAGTVAVSIVDRGVGIPPQHLPRLTERFYRVAPGRAGGVGLGLAIVQQIVTRHRGTLAIESRQGEGSRFTVRLPLARGPEPDPAQARIKALDGATESR